MRACLRTVKNHAGHRASRRRKAAGGGRGGGQVPGASGLPQGRGCGLVLPAPFCGKMKHRVVFLQQQTGEKTPQAEVRPAGSRGPLGSRGAGAGSRFHQRETPFYKRGRRDPAVNEVAESRGECRLRHGNTLTRVHRENLLCIRKKK